MTSHNNPYSRRGDDDRYDAYRPSRDAARPTTQDRPRDRDRDRDRDRNPSSLASPRDPPKGGVSLGPRPEPPNSSSTKQPSSGPVRLEDVLRSWMARAQKKAKIEQNLELKRVAQAQRKMEYAKSMAKHTEYPSVPEYQNKFRDRHEKELAQLEESYKTAVVDYEKATEQFAANISKTLPLEIEALVKRNIQGHAQKHTGVDDTRLKSLEAAVDVRISSLDKSIDTKTKAIELAAKQAQGEIKAAIASEREKSRKEMDEKMSKQQELIDKLLASQRSMQEQIAMLQNEKTVGQTNSAKTTQDLRVQVERLETKQNADRDLQAEHNRKVSADVSKIYLENGRLRHDFDSLRETTARRSDLGSLRTACSDLQAEAAWVSTSLSQLKDDNKTLNTRVGEHVELTRQNVNKLAQLDEVTRQHQDELSRLDLNILEQVAEGWSIDWPNVLAAVQAFDGVQSRVEKLEQAYPDVVRHTDRLAQVEQDAQSVAQTVTEIKGRVGRLTPSVSAQSGEDVSRQVSIGTRGDEDHSLQDLRSRVLAFEDRLKESNEFDKKAIGVVSHVQQELSRRVKQIETHVLELATQAAARPAFQPDPAVSKLNSRVDSFNGELGKISMGFQDVIRRIDTVKFLVHQFETRLDELQRPGQAQDIAQSDPEVNKFKTKVEKFEGEFEKLSTEVQGVTANFEYLNHQVTALDSRCNNITTRTLAEHIIAQMEQVYPANREILANMQELQRRLEIVDQESKRARETAEDVRQRLNLVVGNQAASGIGAVPGAGNKRRRVDEGSDGSPEVPSSGTPTAASAGISI